MLIIDRFASVLKKYIFSLLLILAAVLCCRDLVKLSNVGKDVVCFFEDLNEDENSKESEKEDLDEKDVFSFFDSILVVSNMSLKELFILNHGQDSYGILKPYFEVNSPPPEITSA